jgi:hypothetical protein
MRSKNSTKLSIIATRRSVCRTFGLLLLFAFGVGPFMSLGRSAGHAQEVGALAVVVKPVRGAEGTVSALEIREQLQSSTRDSAPLRLKAALSAITVKHIADSITNLQVTDAQGSVPFTTTDDPPVTSDDSAYRHWTATRQTNSAITISYRFPTNPIVARRGPPLGMERAGQGVAGSGIGFFLLPENSTSETTKLSWDLSDMPPDSVGVTTAGEGQVNIAGPPSELFKLWVLAGPALTVQAPRPSGFSAYLVGTPPFDGKEMLEWASKAYSSIGSSFQYMGLPKYNLMIRALDGESLGTGTAGEGRGASLINVGKTYWPNQDRTYFRNTIFHEMTHQWVGLIKGRASWYEEGLTVYVTATLPCESHLLNPAECADDLNRTLESYYTSEGRNWSQQKITDSPFLNEGVRDVPYGRGALYFASLNSQLLAKSHGRRDLKTALHPLFVARRDGNDLDQGDFETMLRRELGPVAIIEFHEEVIDGTKEIVPPSNAFGPCLMRVRVTLPPDKGGRSVNGYVWHPIGKGAPARCNIP